MALAKEVQGSARILRIPDFNRHQEHLQPSMRAHRENNSVSSSDVLRVPGSNKTKNKLKSHSQAALTLEYKI